MVPWRHVCLTIWCGDQVAPEEGGEADEYLSRPTPPFHEDITLRFRDIRISFEARGRTGDLRVATRYVYGHHAAVRIFGKHINNRCRKYACSSASVEWRAPSDSQTEKKTQHIRTNLLLHPISLSLFHSKAFCQCRLEHQPRLISSFNVPHHPLYTATTCWHELYRHIWGPQRVLAVFMTGTSTGDSFQRYWLISGGISAIDPRGSLHVMG